MSIRLLPVCFPQPSTSTARSVRRPGKVGNPTLSDVVLGWVFGGFGELLEHGLMDVEDDRKDRRQQKAPCRHCYECHGAQASYGGVRGSPDSRGTVRRGHSSRKSVTAGHAIQPVTCARLEPATDQDPKLISRAYSGEAVTTSFGRVRIRASSRSGRCSWRGSAREAAHASRRSPRSPRGRSDGSRRDPQSRGGRSRRCGAAHPRYCSPRLCNPE